MKQASTRTWFVTGASSGLGHEIVRAALCNGDNVVATARTLDAVAGFEADYPEQALALSLDIRDSVQIEQAIAAAESRFGGVNVLVNNASFGQFGAVEELSDAEVRLQFDTNCFGTFAVIRAMLPHFRERNGGTILNISSISAHVGFGGLSLYAATKCALEGLSTVLAHEVARFGIKVSVIVPGALDTRFASNMHMADPIACYDFMRTEWNGWKAVQQFSDLQKTAEAVYLAGTMADPPKKLPLGADALEMMKAEYREGLDLCARWESLALSPAPAPVAEVA